MLEKLLKIMGIRGVTEKYHAHELTKKEADELEKEVMLEANFTPDETDSRLFQGEIYEANKASTRIIRGTWNGEPAVLKVQLLPPDIEEADQMNHFNGQNKSSKIRAAHIRKHEPYSPEKSYGYMVMESVEGRRPFEGMANESKMAEFAEIYKELVQAGLNKPWLEARWYEGPKNAVRATALRLFNWLSISKKQGHLNPEKVRRSTRHLLKMTLSGTQEINFTHGHFSANDLLISGDDVVLFSQAYWKYLPKHYACTFGIWATLKDLRGNEIPEAEAALEYAEKWKVAFKKALNFEPSSPKAAEFDRYFASNMRERALGALIIDIDSDLKGGKMEEGEANQLKAMFSGIYNYYRKS